MDKEIRFLKESLMYQMSLGSRELFHSNVWAWLMEMDNNFLLYPINNSNVSKYTIDKLRLNRKNLVNLSNNIKLNNINFIFSSN